MKTSPLLFAAGIALVTAVSASPSDPFEGVPVSAPAASIADMRSMESREEIVAGDRGDTTWFGGYEIIEDEYYAVSSSSKQDVNEWRTAASNLSTVVPRDVS